jgi:hypothetical protein
MMNSLRNACEQYQLPIPKDIDYLSTAQLRKKIQEIRPINKAGARL